jgi:hypothetical protein
MTILCLQCNAMASIKAKIRKSPTKNIRKNDRPSFPSFEVFPVWSHLQQTRSKHIIEHKVTFMPYTIISIKLNLLISYMWPIRKVGSQMDNYLTKIKKADMHAFIHTYIYIYIYIHIFLYIYTYIYIYIRTCRDPFILGYNHGPDTWR